MSETYETLDRTEAPFDTAKLDRLMDEAGIDVLLATSKHNTRYLMGGYTFLFFSAMEAIGHSRYLPVVIYAKGRPDRAAYVGNSMETYDNEVRPFWTPTLYASAWSTTDSAVLVAEHLKKIGATAARIGVEPSFLPANALATLKAELGAAQIADASSVLERLRAIKTPAELDKLRRGSELITDAMLATIGWARDGVTKAEIIERLRREEVQRGLHFDYCLLTLGASHNRAPSEQAWAAGDVLSIDSGGNLDGYIGDLARMGVLGEPDAELDDLLAEVDGVQQAAFAKVRAGADGGEIGVHAQEVMHGGPNGGCSEFFVHGMGLISHEVPFLMKNRYYDPIDAGRPLEPGMVLSIETTMHHPRRGFIKLEDTVAVTADGYELFGERGRGWNRGGTGA